MQELCWLEGRIGSIESAVDLANQLYWNLTVWEYATPEGEVRWNVHSGEAVIFRTTRARPSMHFYMEWGWLIPSCRSLLSS